jgi:hypothetical protein
MVKIEDVTLFDQGRQVFPSDAFYGDFYDIYNVKIDASLKDINIFLEDVLHLETRLFSIYVLYVLSKNGYRLEHNDDDISKWEIQDWIMNNSWFEVSYEPYREFWSFDLISNQNTLRAIFVRDRVARPKHVDVSIDFSGALDASISNRILIHLNENKNENNSFSMFGKFMEKDRIYSSKAFFHRFVPNKTERDKINKGWNKIRDGILSDFKIKYPFLRYSVFYHKYKEAEKQISEADAQIKLGLDYCKAIRSMGFAIEILLQCMAEVEGINTERAMGTLLRELKTVIETDFGEDQFLFLFNIKNLRNNCTHPPFPDLDYKHVSIFLLKTKFFLDYFNLNYIAHKM